MDTQPITINLPTVPIDAKFYVLETFTVFNVFLLSWVVCLWFIYHIYEVRSQFLPLNLTVPSYCCQAIFALINYPTAAMRKALTDTLENDHFIGSRFPYLCLSSTLQAIHALINYPTAATRKALTDTFENDHFTESVLVSTFIVSPVKHSST